jgi:hypothetical protein
MRAAHRQHFASRIFKGVAMPGRFDFGYKFAPTLLVPNALKAVQHWQFKPPMLEGKPVLVFTLWTFGYETAEEAR